jgi:hypothetical protein
MNHKLQFPSFTNDGSKTVGRTDTTSQIASNDAGLELRPVAACVPHDDSSRDSQLSEVGGSVATIELDNGNRSICEASLDQEISTGIATQPRAQPPSGVLSIRTEIPSEPNAPGHETRVPDKTHPGAAPSGQERTQPAQTLPDSHSQARCEVARSAGYDPTGEHAVVCGALAQLVCEYCGPMCSSCAEETFCFYGEHRLVEAKPPTGTLSSNSGAADEPAKPLFEVVYLELQCPQCDTVRLAISRANAPDAHWTLACPICSTPTTWTYLAHGLTQHELPFYECFDPDSLSKGRIPWDKLLQLLDEEE